MRLNEFDFCFHAAEEAILRFRIYYSNDPKEFRRSDKEGIWGKDNFAYFSIKTYIVGTH